MTSEKSNQGGWSIDRRTALKAAGLAGVGMFGGATFSGTVGATEHVTENIGFVPNASDGTVSKVDLLIPEVIDTITIVDPHEGELTNRMVIDPGTGNAWVLNSGRGLNPPDDSGVESQGQVIEIDRETDDTTAYDIGGIGDKPRAIEWVDGKLWVGFYDADSEQYLLELDPEELDDAEVAEDEGDAGVDRKVILGDDVRPYTLVYDASRETLWLSSRSGSRMTAEGNDSVYSIYLGGDQPQVTPEEDGLNDPYFIAIDNENTVWVTDYPRNGTTDGFVAHYDRDGDGDWGQVTIDDAGPMRGLAVDDNDDLWLATAGGEIIQLETPDDTIGFRASIGSDNVGVGIDPGGRIWVIDRVEDRVRRLSDPLDENNSVDEELVVGREPYAYGDFVVEEHKKF